MIAKAPVTIRSAHRVSYVCLQHLTSPRTTHTSRTRTAMCSTVWPPTWTCESAPSSGFCHCNGQQVEVDGDAGGGETLACGAGSRCDCRCALSIRWMTALDAAGGMRQTTQQTTSRGLAVAAPVSCAKRMLNAPWQWWPADVTSGRLSVVSTHLFGAPQTQRHAKPLRGRACCAAKTPQGSCERSTVPWQGTQLAVRGAAARGPPPMVYDVVWGRGLSGGLAPCLLHSQP